MLYLFIIVVLVFVLWPVVREPVSRWFSGFMARRTEDMMRRMMGMPSRKEERRRQKENQRRKSSFERGGGDRANSNSASRHTVELMKSVAVDVEYIEIKEFESKTIIEENSDGTRIVLEEQISDVEFTEIRL